MVDIDKQSKLRDFVNREVGHCQSTLIDELIKREIFNFDDIENFYESLEDTLNGLAKDALLDILHGSDIDTDEWKDKTESEITAEILSLEASGIINPCNVEREPQAIYEWWLVNDWFIEKLRAEGEPILENDYGTWWGRTCTGQAIFLDYVIEKIYDGLQ